MQVLEEPRTLSKADRISRILQSLKVAHRMCATPLGAYLYVASVFHKTEEEFAPEGVKHMHLLKFPKFFFHKEVGIYKWAPHSHVFFIHKDGGYAIYKKVPDHHHYEYINLYRNAVPEVMVPSKKTRKNVWDDVPKETLIA